MKRALPALLLAVTATGGVVGAGGNPAANAQKLTHLHSMPPPQNDAQPAPSGWLWSNPNIPVTTQMVIPRNTVTGAEVVQYAERFLGYPYTLTGNAPSLGFSCIGFVSYVYQSLGIPLPDELGNARAYVPAVSFGELRPGDILWFGNTVWPGLSHTAIYLGGGRFIHAAWFGIGVITSSFVNDPRYGNYWTQHYFGASRPWGGAGSQTPGFAATIDHALYPASLRAVPQTPALLVTAPAQRLHAWWSLSAPVTQVVSQATPLIPLQRQGVWYQVMTPDGRSGWVATASAVPRLAAGRPLPASALSASRTSTASRHHSSAVQRTVTRSHVRVVAAATDSAPLPADPTASKQPANVSSRDRTRWVSGRPLRIPFTLNLRTSPSRQGTLLSVVVPGERAVLRRVSGAWGEVALPGGVTGWIDLSVIPGTHAGGKMSATPTARARRVRGRHHPAGRVAHSRPRTGLRVPNRVGHTVHVRATIRLHARPGMNAGALGVVVTGTRVRVLGQRGIWLRVRLPGGMRGWIDGTFAR